MSYAIRLKLWPQKQQQIGHIESEISDISGTVAWLGLASINTRLDSTRNEMNGMELLQSGENDIKLSGEK